MIPARSPQATHADQLAERIPLDGLTAVDVGCGNGAFVVELSSRNARVTGIEIDEASVARARKEVGQRGEILVGSAESLPLHSGSSDLVCFIFSFHHVPARLQVQALDEAVRVLRPGGHLHVVDPRPYGPLYEVLQPIEDEHEVRARSQSLLAGLRGGDLSRVAETEYEIVRVFRDAASLIESAITVDPSRAAAARDPGVREIVSERFARHSRPESGGFALPQPCVAFTFTRK